jgi:hypothetical protein
MRRPLGLGNGAKRRAVPTNVAILRLAVNTL